MSINCSLNKNKNKKECKHLPKPLIPYFGGKQRVADKIISQFPEHKIYVEPFVGGGSIYWKNTIPEKFVINDLDKDIYKLYKYAKYNPSSIKKCNLNDIDKEKWKKLKKKKSKSPCDVIKLYKHGFSGSLTGYAKKNRKFNNPLTEEHTKKLRKTLINNKDFRNVALEYDKKGVVQYWDPPYVEGGKNYATKGVTPEEVCNIAKKIKKAKVFISYDNNKRVKKACKGLKFKKIKVPYSAGNFRGEKTELLITNF